ncbi:MurR/RpiR family transcriptional regulator [Mesoplasma florum]|uniref:hypothetical protein n=1 Tax=Mesoplasma florum TaxID=2151 RepID=UPI000D086861|nr:hypothetical protein [Mesoplasma florum]AVN60694.1 hypothetical protein CG005_00055 [Mesoplasma florum]
MAWIFERVEAVSNEYKESTYKLIAEKIKELAIANTLDISQKELASICFVSESTITKFSKYLGFSGFREFWFMLKKERINFNGLQKELIKKEDDFFKPIFLWLKQNENFIGDLAKSISLSESTYVYTSYQMIHSAKFMEETLNSIMKRCQILNQHNLGYPFYKMDKKYTILVILSGRDNENLAMCIQALNLTKTKYEIDIYVITTENQIHKIKTEYKDIMFIDIIPEWPSTVHRNIAFSIFVGSLYSKLLSFK